MRRCCFCIRANAIRRKVPRVCMYASVQVCLFVCKCVFVCVHARASVRIFANRCSESTCLVTLLSIRQRRRREGRLAKGFRSRMLRRELLASIIVCRFGSESFRSSPIRKIRLFETSSVFSRFSSGKFCGEKVCTQVGRTADRQGSRERSGRQKDRKAAVQVACRDSREHHYGQWPKS
jgi:hypothetical protein